MTINNYKFNYSEDNYIIGFYAVLGDDYDFKGQMAEYPDILDSFPEGWYKFKKGEFVLDEDRKTTVLAERQAKEEEPTDSERLEAQVTYTAMMTDTLLED